MGDGPLRRAGGAPGEPPDLPRLRRPSVVGELWVPGVSLGIVALFPRAGGAALVAGALAAAVAAKRATPVRPAVRAVMLAAAAVGAALAAAWPDPSFAAGAYFASLGRDPWLRAWTGALAGVLVGTGPALAPFVWRRWRAHAVYQRAHDAYERERAQDA